MSNPTRRRPWLAALLALVISGLGHAYLRRWARALGWYVAVTATVFVFVPESAISGALTGDPPPLREIAPAAAVVVASVIDAYVLAVRTNRAADRNRDGAGTTDSPEPATGPRETGTSVSDDDKRPESAATVSCPECGRSTDPSYDFCQWCAEPVEGGKAS